MYHSSGWKKEKERFDGRLVDLQKVYEASEIARTEQQREIVLLHSQLRKLREALDKVEADKNVLQNARYILQEKLDTIKLDTTEDATKPQLTSQWEIQQLQLVLDKERDQVIIETECRKKAEDRAATFQAEISNVRLRNAELERHNVSFFAILA